MTISYDDENGSMRLLSRNSAMITSRISGTTICPPIQDPDKADIGYDDSTRTAGPVATITPYAMGGESDDGRKGRDDWSLMGFYQPFFGYGNACKVAIAMTSRSPAVTKGISLVHGTCLKSHMATIGCDD